MDEEERDETPLWMCSFEQIWEEFAGRYGTALLLVLCREGRPDEHIRAAGSGGMYQRIGMLAAAQVASLRSIGDMDRNDDFEGKVL